MSALAGRDERTA